jgi:hypothetical protein
MRAQQTVAVAGVVVLCLGTAVIGRPAVARQATPLPAVWPDRPTPVPLWAGWGTPAQTLLDERNGTATAVTGVVAEAVLPAAVAIETALTAATRAAQSYCVGHHRGLAVCFESAVDGYDPATVTLAEVFRQQAQRLSGTSQALATDLATLRLVSPLVTAQMDGLLEDLALCAEQLMLLLQEYAQPLLALGQLPPTVAGAQTAVQGLGYAARAQSLAGLLARAEGWLETIDHETGAQAGLPGFEPGAPPLESRLALL